MSKGFIDEHSGWIIHSHYRPQRNGKTTLFRILSGLDHDYSGTYLLNGKDVSHLSEEEWLKSRRENTGVIFQDFNLISTLTVAENAVTELFLFPNKIKFIFLTSKRSIHFQFHSFCFESGFFS